jgi:hypothetical protein
MLRCHEERVSRGGTGRGERGRRGGREEERGDLIPLPQTRFYPETRFLVETRFSVSQEAVSLLEAVSLRSCFSKKLFLEEAVSLRSCFSKKLFLRLRGKIQTRYEDTAMLSRAQVVLLVSLLSWLLVVFHLMNLRAESKAREAEKMKRLRTAITNTVLNTTSSLVDALHLPSIANTPKQPLIIPGPSKETSQTVIQPSSTNPPTMIRPVTVTETIPNSAPKQSSAKVFPKDAPDYAIEGGMSWKDFVTLPHYSGQPDHSFPSKSLNTLLTCSKEVEGRLDARLSEEKFKWCQWALSNNGGQVKVLKIHFVLNRYILLSVHNYIGRNLLWKAERQGAGTIRTV